MASMKGMNPAAAAVPARGRAENNIKAAVRHNVNLTMEGVISRVNAAFTA